MVQILPWPTFSPSPTLLLKALVKVLSPLSRLAITSLLHGEEDGSIPSVGTTILANGVGLIALG